MYSDYCTDKGSTVQIYAQKAHSQVPIGILSTDIITSTGNLKLHEIKVKDSSYV